MFSARMVNIEITMGGHSIVSPAPTRRAPLARQHDTLPLKGGVVAQPRSLPALRGGCRERSERRVG